MILMKRKYYFQKMEPKEKEDPQPPFCFVRVQNVNSLRRRNTMDRVSCVSALRSSLSDTAAASAVFVNVNEVVIYAPKIGVFDRHVPSPRTPIKGICT